MFNPAVSVVVISKPGPDGTIVPTPGSWVGPPTPVADVRVTLLVSLMHDEPEGALTPHWKIFTAAFAGTEANAIAAVASAIFKTGYIPYPPRGALISGLPNRTPTR